MLKSEALLSQLLRTPEPSLNYAGLRMLEEMSNERTEKDSDAEVEEVFFEDGVEDTLEER